MDVNDRGKAVPGLVSRRSFTGLLAAAPLLAATPAFAQTDRGATAILRSLAPHDRRARIGGRAGAPRLKRIIIVMDGARREIVIDLSRMVEVTVFFDHDSAALRAGAQLSLDLLVEALQNEILADQTFLVAGHTNSVGDYDYNVDLSRRRAQSVSRWLVSVGGVNAGRLLYNGFGPDMLRDPRRPASPINRRVEVIAIDPSAAIESRPSSGPGPSRVEPNRGEPSVDDANSILRR